MTLHYPPGTKAQPLRSRPRGVAPAGVDTTSGTTAPTGIALETDASLALGRRKTKAAGLSTETDSALALAAQKAAEVGLAGETDAALPLSPRKGRVAGLATETDSSLALARRKTAGLSLSLESDSALALTRAKAKGVGLGEETDTALPLLPASGPIVRLVGLAEEFDEALALSPVVPQMVVQRGGGGRPVKGRKRKEQEPPLAVIERLVEKVIREVQAPPEEKEEVGERAPSKNSPILASQVARLLVPPVPSPVLALAPTSIQSLALAIEEEELQLIAELDDLF